VTTITRENIESLTTDWFPADINPVHLGFYEVKIVTWPWPIMIEWFGEKWDTDIEVKTWRGLKDCPL
jgi:hypothetical protein